MVNRNIDVADFTKCVPLSFKTVPKKPDIFSSEHPNLHEYLFSLLNFSAQLSLTEEDEAQ